VLLCIEEHHCMFALCLDSSPGTWWWPGRWVRRCLELTPCSTPMLVRAELSSHAPESMHQVLPSRLGGTQKVVVVELRGLSSVVQGRRPVTSGVPPCSAYSSVTWMKGQSVLSASLLFTKS